MGCSSAHFALPSRLAATPKPWVPSAAELTASQTTPLWVARLAASFRDAFSWDLRTNGHPGLNHSSTTVLPLNEESFTGLPSRSSSSKSGAVLPTSALPAGAVAVVAVPGRAPGRGVVALGARSGGGGAAVVSGAC